MGVLVELGSPCCCAKLQPSIKAQGKQPRLALQSSEKQSSGSDPDAPGSRWGSRWGWGQKPGSCNRHLAPRGIFLGQSQRRSGNKREIFVIFHLPLVCTEVSAVADGAQRSPSRPRQPQTSESCSKIFLQRLQIQSSVLWYRCSKEGEVTGKRPRLCYRWRVAGTAQGALAQGRVPRGSCRSPWFKKVFISGISGTEHSSAWKIIAESIIWVSRGQILREALQRFRCNVA